MTSPSATDAAASRAARFPRGAVADLVIGVVTALGGGATIAYALTMPTLDGGGPGPGLFPGIIGGALVLFGAILAVKTLVRPAAADAVEAESALPPETESIKRIADVETSTLSLRRALVNGAVIVGSILFYVLAADHLGFLITMFVVVLVNMLALRAKALTSLISSLVLTVVMWLVFEKALLVQLPDGLLF